MLLRIAIGTLYLSSIITGQTGDFEQECYILKTMDNLEARLQKQETLVEQQTTRLQEQENQLLQQDALLKNKTAMLQQQEALLEQQTTRLQQQDTLLESHTTRLQEQESLVEQQAAMLQQQKTLLEQQTTRLQQQDTLLESHTTRLQQQETLVEQQNTRLKQQQAQLDNQTTELQKQEGILDSQTTQLNQQEVLLKNQTTLLQRQEVLLEQTEDRIRELEAEIATPKLPNGDCGVLFASGTTQSGVYAISPDRNSPFDVYCDMTDGGWTVIQRRTDGAVNFSRTWDDYVQGFGDVNGEYWLGLEKIHRLTKDGAEIYFDIEHYDGTREYAHYKNFTVHDATTLYKMNVDSAGYNGSFAEVFSYHDDMKFSTYDRNNDDSRGNCAQSYGGGGWWFNNCFWLGNFNGVFGKTDFSGICYYNNNFRVYVKTVTIKLRQRL